MSSAAELETALQTFLANAQYAIESATDLDALAEAERTYLGKSSTLNLVAERIQRDHKNAVVVRFDPWLISGRNDS